MSRLARALLLIGGASVLAVLVAWVGIGSVAALLRRVGWAFVAVSVLYAAHLSVRAAALWRSLPVPSLGYLQVLRIRFAGAAVEMLTFTGPFLAEPTKGLLLARSGTAGADAFGAVAIEYLLYTLVSSWLAAGALTLLLARGLLTPALHGPIAILIGGVAAFTVGFFVAAITGVGLIVPALRGAGRLVAGDRARRVAARVEPVERVMVEFIHRRPARLFELLLIEAAGHGLLALEIAVVMGALALPFVWRDPFTVEGGIKFVSVAFFFVPGQVGAQESVYTVLFQALGFPAAAGLTMALVRRVRALVVAGAGTMALAFTS